MKWCSSRFKYASSDNDNFYYYIINILQVNLQNYAFLFFKSGDGISVPYHQEKLQRACNSLLFLINVSKPTTFLSIISNDSFELLSNPNLLKCFLAKIVWGKLIILIFRFWLLSASANSCAKLVNPCVCVKIDKSAIFIPAFQCSIPWFLALLNSMSALLLIGGDNVYISIGWFSLDSFNASTSAISIGLFAHNPPST